MLNNLIEIFHNANAQLLNNDTSLFRSEVSERTLCGALMLHLNRYINESEYSNYYVDVEYNRNSNRRIKTCVKTIQGLRNEIITINCDLIVHSRGEIIQQDNLIAIEMKKSNRPLTEKEKDRQRLMALTKDSYDDVWSFDGRELPRHVCRYILGVYYEVNYRKRKIKLEYYQSGNMFRERELNY